MNYTEKRTEATAKLKELITDDVISDVKRITDYGSGFKDATYYLWDLAYKNNIDHFYIDFVQVTREIYLSKFTY